MALSESINHSPEEKLANKVDAYLWDAFIDFCTKHHVVADISFVKEPFKEIKNEVFTVFQSTPLSDAELKAMIGGKLRLFLIHTEYQKDTTTTSFVPKERRLEKVMQFERGHIFKRLISWLTGKR